MMTKSRFEERIMHITKIFPVILITLDIAAALVYCQYGDIRHTIYWFAAATLTATVTF
jgi:hypothetical protein